MQPYLTTKCNVSMLSINAGCIALNVVVLPSRGLRVKVLIVSLQTQSDFMVICNVAKILELVVPLMDHPSESFLTTIEEDLMKLIIKYGMTVSCAAYTSALVSSALYMNSFMMQSALFLTGCAALRKLSRCGRQ